MKRSKSMERRSRSDRRAGVKAVYKISRTGSRVPKAKGSWTVYVLECLDGSYYCGITNDLTARLSAHNTGRGARYTRSRRPVSVIYRERRASKGAALRREAEIKQLTRKQKEELVSGNF